ncbi:MAG: HIT domain-containing protein [Enterobacterales bacterium]
MLNKNIFINIINNKKCDKIIYKDKLVTAFHDIKPKTPVHIIIVTNKCIPTVNDVTHNDEMMLGRLFTVASKLAKKMSISKNGYRLVVNCNNHGGQIINHLHMHLIGGKVLGNFF